MHITKIELENIKSYETAEFEFGRGTTAIMGENGAGKTTLIEAVAWTLFDLLDYKKDDFLKRGTKRGLVRVEFESGLDERRYIVQRDTRTAYFVYDPKLKTRIADKKEEVTRFLWQHLGVEAGTDLESLFRRAIGVPQGTFTAIFLETPNERKKAFDKLLKVEEYRIGAMRLGRTAKHIDSQILDVVQHIARAEGELSNRKKYKEERKEFSKSEKEFRAALKKAEKSVNKQRLLIEKLENLKSKFEKCSAAARLLEEERKRMELIAVQRENELERAEKAAIVLQSTAEEYSLYKKATVKLTELERERKKREKLRNSLTDIEKAILSVRAEQKSVQAHLDDIEAKRKSVTALEPQIKDQEKLEADKKRLGESVSKARDNEARVKSLEQRLIDLRNRHKLNETEIKKTVGFEQLATRVDQIRELSEKTTNELASLRARIERDREFQIQIKDGLCPVFSAKCLNLKEGETLDGFLSDKFGDLNARVRDLETEQNAQNKSAKEAREAQTAYSGLALLVKRREEIIEDGKKLRAEQEKLKSDAAIIPDADVRLKLLDEKLEKLGDPKGRSKLLKKELGRVRSLREQLTNFKSNFERLESERRLKVEHLETYKDLDSNWKEFSEMRDKTAEAHNNYIKNEGPAKSLSEAKTLSKQTADDIKKLQVSLARAQSKLEKAEAKFEPESYRSELEALRAGEIELTRATSEAQHSAVRRKEIETELEKLKVVEKQLNSDKKEKKDLDKLTDAVKFIRSTLKAAAPRVAKNYVFHVSVEANTLYREITGNAEVTLRWTDDYGIELEEDGFSRPFVSLSGGEQMSAALAVRLALLRQLSDIRLAFFDEPTTNMDLERRERLAEQISRITENQTFDQLFVISHDDTFESFADHVIAIG